MGFMVFVLVLGVVRFWWDGAMEEEEVLESLLLGGWVERFARIGGRGWRVEWTHRGANFSTLWRWAFIIAELGDRSRRPGFWIWLEHGRGDERFEELGEMRGLLFRTLSDCGDAADGEAREVFLDLCVRHAPGGENGI